MALQDGCKLVDGVSDIPQGGTRNISKQVNKNK